MVHVESRSWKTTNGISHKPGYFLFTLRAMTQSFRTKKFKIKSAMKFCYQWTPWSIVNDESNFNKIV